MIEEGFLELYHGLTPNNIGVILYVGVNYFASDKLRFLYKRLSQGERIGNIQTFLIVFASTFPIKVEAIKGRVVNSNRLDALQDIVWEHGISGLYRALGPRCLKSVPVAGLSIMCYKALKVILSKICSWASGISA
ncbi:adenine nucleotide transporter BT1, chloroplastic/mitochondrial-like [Physcomitrium patens]|uniref:adenine nucleotide transporter BT1, chloroplastic/mitochondrial-like n=1 Tax=Physcomitrium patens TaxID=3218 RepID=UPI003CCD758A